MTAVSHTVALLAPVPEEHLLSGREICLSEGFVAFGSMSWEVFRKLDKHRDGLPVEVLIYASYSQTHARNHVGWRGKYIGHVDSVGGMHPDGMRYRPPSTAKYEGDNQGHWVVFWHVTDLEPLSEEDRIYISDLRGVDKKTKYVKGFVPRGPVIIEAP